MMVYRASAKIGGALSLAKNESLLNLCVRARVSNRRCLLGFEAVRESTYGVVD